MKTTIESSVMALFRRMPLLAGFHVGDDLSLAEIEFERWPGFNPGEELYEEIANALMDAIDDDRDAVEFLRNRTFARSLQ
jgi:hypothetical protein